MDQDDHAVERENDAIKQIARRLHQRFDAALGPHQVDKALDTARHRFARSRIRSFIPILVERAATDDLHERERHQ